MKEFTRLLDVCREQGILVELENGAAAVPDTILGTPLDPGLRQLYTAHDGGTLRREAWRFTLYPVTGEEGLAHHNESLRKLSGDYPEPYPFSDLLIFAQHGLQATYFATVPRLADSTGKQPVVLVDTHEDPWALPVASGVDALFSLLANYLSIAMKDGAITREFPLEVPELIRSDQALGTLVRAKGFAPLIRGDQSVQGWMRQAFG